MQPLDLERLEQAIIRSKEQAMAEGVLPENLDAVASVMVVVELVTAVDSTEVSPKYSVDLPETFAEWAMHFSLQSHYDRFLAAAVYLYEQEGIQAVNSESILQMYQRARWDRPKNPADVFAKCGQRVWFVEADGIQDSALKMWRITRTGYDRLKSMRQEESSD